MPARNVLWNGPRWPPRVANGFPERVEQVSGLCQVRPSPANDLIAEGSKGIFTTFLPVEIRRLPVFQGPVGFSDDSDVIPQEVDAPDRIAAVIVDGDLLMWHGQAPSVEGRG